MNQALPDTSPLLKVDLPTAQLHVRQFQQAMQDYEQRHAAWKARQHPRGKEPRKPFFWPVQIELG